jgi:tRNA dimethylallyltransferase
VRHYLIDLIEPTEEMSMVAFTRHFDAAVADITHRGGIPVVVGGTGLYLQAVLDRLTAPGTWPEVRGALEAELAAGTTVPELHARLADLDPLAASRMEPTNARRVVRALEVCVGSGRPFSDSGPGMTAWPASATRRIGLRWPRDVQAERIARRVASMMDGGLLDEAVRLHGLGERLSRTAHQALGYRELLDHLGGRCTLDDAVAATVTRTRQFAVRQERWFRRDPRIDWIDASKANPLAALDTCVRVLGAS